MLPKPAVRSTWDKREVNNTDRKPQHAQSGKGKKTKQGQKLPWVLREDNWRLRVRNFDFKAMHEHFGKHGWGVVVDSGTAEASKAPNTARNLQLHLSSNCCSKPAPDLFVQAGLTEKLHNAVVVCDCRIYARLFQLHGTVFAIIPCNHEDWLEAEHGVISAFRKMSVMMKKMP